MVDQLSAFASEVTRAWRARSVPRASSAVRRQVPGVAGTWKDLDRQRQLHGLEPDRPGPQHRRGDHCRWPAVTCRRRSRSTCAAKSCSSRKPSTRWSTSCAPLPRKSPRVAREVGTEGRLGGQAVGARRRRYVEGLDRTTVNGLARNLTTQVRNIAEVTTAVARGDLNRKITVDVKGEILELKNTINTMVDQLNSFAGGSDARGARSRHRGAIGRPGGGARRRAARGRISPTTSTSWRRT